MSLSAKEVSILLVSLASLLYCTKYETILHFKKLDRSLYSETETRVFNYESGTISAEGKIRMAPSFWFKSPTLGCVLFPPESEQLCNDWQEFPRTGSWKFLYPNGNLKAEISFKVHYGFFCSTAHEMDYYDEKVQEFSAWYENGQLMARGKFETEIINVDNSCEGGQDLKIGEVSENTYFFDKKGNIITNIHVQDSLKTFIEQL